MSCMKKRTFVIGALMSLLPIGQLQVVGTGFLLTTATLGVLFDSQKVFAEGVSHYLFKLEEIYQIEGKEKETITYANKILEIDPNNVDGYWYRGYAKSELGQLKSALIDYNKAIKIDPNDSASYNNRGYVKEQLGKFKAAILDYNKAIEIDPKHTFAYVGRGVAKAELGKFKAAILDYDKALAIDFNDDPEYLIGITEAYYFRGVAKEMLGDLKGACLDWKEASFRGDEGASDFRSKFCITAQ